MRASTWYEAVYQCQQQGRAYVIVTVLTSAGSTPREAGCKMVVSGDAQFDSIGGGHLEFTAVASARDLLAANKQAQKTVSYPLSSRLGQCCGGAVKVLYEVHVKHNQHIAVFGAGHVAQSLVPMLAQLPVKIHWIDSREHFFDDIVNAKVTTFSTNTFDPRVTPSNVRTEVNDEPRQVLAELPRNTWLVILTHNHQLDYELVESALKLGSFGYIGMIGSVTKAQRFLKKLEHRGFSASQRARLISPIGDLSIPGKRPIEVSVSICAQLIKLLHRSSVSAQTEQNQTIES